VKIALDLALVVVFGIAILINLLKIIYLYFPIKVLEKIKTISSYPSKWQLTTYYLLVIVVLIWTIQSTLGRI